MENDEPRRIRVMLLDDHDVARHQSAARLGRHARLEIVGDASEYTEGLKLAQELQPDVILVETRRLDGRGLEVIATLAGIDEAQRPAIIAYLEILHDVDWPDARGAGADDVLLKEMRPDALARELQVVIDRVHPGGWAPAQA